MVSFFFLLPMFLEVSSLFCNAMLSVLFSSAIISLRKRELVALLNHILAVMWLLLFCASSLRCHELVCGQ